MFQTVHLEYHQQRSFTLKMRQNHWRLGLFPRPHWGAYSAPPDHLAGLRGLLLRGGEGEGRDFGPLQWYGIVGFNVLLDTL